MKRRYAFCRLVFILLLPAVVLHAGEGLDIVCTTTHLSAIATAIGGEYTTVTSLIPYGMCPGHFELTPVQVSDLKRADIILAHGYEHFLENLIQKIEIKIDLIDIPGNALLPAVHIRIAEEVTEIMIRRKPQMKELFLQNFEIYKRKIAIAETEIKALMTSFNDVSVLCAEMNSSFLEWLGANIVATFPRDEDLSLKIMNTILTIMKQKNPQLVIDNLQSSGKVGKTFSEELQIPLIVISNFPRDNDYIGTLRNNCQAILESLNYN
jgi:zinc transport system substrate-binding protein